MEAAVVPSIVVAMFLPPLLAKAAQAAIVLALEAYLKVHSNKIL